MADVMPVDFSQRFGLVWRKSLPYMPGDVRERLAALLTPEALATMAGVAAMWAGSHFFGVGEIIDVALLVGGWVAVGAAAGQAAHKLYDVVTITSHARSDADLNRAARELADVAALVGIEFILAMLRVRKPKGTFGFSYKGHLPKPGIAIPSMPRAGPFNRYEFEIHYTRGMALGRGGTNARNVARIGRDWTPGVARVEDVVREVRKATEHEVVHLWLNRAFSTLGRPAYYLRMGAYKRSYILRYLEEAMAEARSQHIVPRREGEVAFYRFPFDPTYQVTLAKMGEELRGVVLGPVTVGGMTLQAVHGTRDARH